MATTTERMVIEAARALVAGALSPDAQAARWDDLEAAVDTLDTAEAATGPREQMLTWGQVVTEDEIKSKDGRWYEVLSTSTTATGVVVRLSGVVKPLAPKASGDEVLVRRGPSGQAADVLMGIVKSGPS